MAGGFCSSVNSELFGIIFARQPRFFRADNSSLILKNPPPPHNGYLTEFSGLNTITWGRTQLSTKQVGLREAALESQFAWLENGTRAGKLTEEQHEAGPPTDHFGGVTTTNQAV